MLPIFFSHLIPDLLSSYFWNTGIKHCFIIDASFDDLVTRRSKVDARNLVAMAKSRRLFRLQVFKKLTKLHAYFTQLPLSIANLRTAPQSSVYPPEKVWNKLWNTWFGLVTFPPWFRSLNTVSESVFLFMCWSNSCNFPFGLVLFTKRLLLYVHRVHPQWTWREFTGGPLAQNAKVVEGYLAHCLHWPTPVQ